nr:MAG TPA: hypothetical protein [Bacteriophage sp.]
MTIYFCIVSSKVSKQTAFARCMIVLNRFLNIWK